MHNAAFLDRCDRVYIFGLKREAMRRREFMAILGGAAA
jgi:hypothetical protein